MKKMFLILLLILIFSATAHAQLNAKTMDYVKLQIAHSGTLRVTGSAERANLSYYIPQDGVLGIKVAADGDMTWRYVSDPFGNRLVLLEWKRPQGTIGYSIELTVENRATYTPTEKPVGKNDFYLQETSYIKIDDNIRQFAFPYEKSMKRAAELTKLVYDYLEYDLSYVGKNVPSDRTLIERRGVCVEHANLLAALLRANEIPARYVVGYAYSAVQEKFIGHTWVEALAADGSWVPFDPTWLQAGYIDATHVKNAVLLDNSQIDTLTYLGGSIAWTRNEERITLLDYTQKPVTSIAATGTDATRDGYGYVMVTVFPTGCVLEDITASSCVDSRGSKKFDIYESNRSMWLCHPTDVYWFFKAPGENYICPVSIYDQSGGSAEHRVTVKGTAPQKLLFISGPDTAGTSESFTLTASTDGLFYSPEFGMRSGRNRTLSVKNPGIYKFYLYSNGSLHIKSITVVQKKEFELSVGAPGSAKLGTSFDISVAVKNLAEPQLATITARYTNQTTKRTIILNTNETKTTGMQLSANKAGLNELVVFATGSSITTHTFIVNTPFEKSLLDRITEAIYNFFAGIADTLGGLFGK